VSAKTQKRSTNSAKSSKKNSTSLIRKKKRRIPKAQRRRYILAFSCMLLLFAAGITGIALRNTHSTSASHEYRIIEISYGMSVRDIARTLRDEGIISSAWGFQWHVRREGLDSRLQAGTYRLPVSLTVKEAAAVVSRGYMQHSHILVYPGHTIEEIARQASGKTEMSEAALLEEIYREAEKRGYPFAEGFFFPGTYRVPVEGFSAAQLAGEGFDRFDQWKEEHREEIEQSPYSLEQIVITASMIQREAGSREEMPLIAGIIWQRLEKGMPLGIDATTRYETGDWKNPIRWEDLQRVTPYNTRRNTGLPPTGISNPGEEALLAALRPEDSPYLYYLHDKEGQIHFAESYQEHREHIERYLR